MRLRFRNILTIKYCNMKKVLFIALSAGVALAACTKNEVKPVNVDQEITFQTVVNKASTKAMIDGSTYDTGNTFGTVAYLEPAGGNSASVYIETSEVKFNTTYWSTDTKYYWPVQGSLSFMSYSPYKYRESDSTDILVGHEYNKLNISNYDVASHQVTDLMVAEIKKGQKANSTQSGAWQKGVPTIFHHKLSQVVAINFQTVDTENPSIVKDYANTRDGSENHKYKSGDQQYFINEVSFKNTYFKGSYVYDGTAETASESWTKGATSVESTGWYKETTANSSGKFSGGTFNTTNNQNGGLNYLLVLPQTFTNTGSKDQALYIKYTVRTYYKNDVLATANTGYTDEVIETTVPLYKIHATDNKWDMNKKITYTISLTKQRIYWDPSVVDWTPESPSVSI